MTTVVCKIVRSNYVGHISVLSANIDMDLCAVKIGVFRVQAEFILNQIAQETGLTIDNDLAQRIADFIYGLEVDLDEPVRIAVVHAYPSIAYQRPELMPHMPR